MTVYSPGCSLKGHDCGRQRWLKGEELWAGCPAFFFFFCCPFHVFWCENKRGKFKARANLIQRCLSLNFWWRSWAANISWFRQLLLKLVGIGAVLHFECGWWCQTLRARLYIPSERAQTFEGLYFPLTVSFSMLWCRNRRAAMCRDTGTLLFQTAAGMSVNLSASHLCHASAHSPSIPTHNPELMTASPHLHPIMTRMPRQLKMFTPIAKTLHVPQSGLFSLWWDC